MKYFWLVLVVLLMGCPDGRITGELCVNGYIYLNLSCSQDPSNGPCWIPKFGDDGKPIKCKEKE
jgi:hypothetical protein